MLGYLHVVLPRYARHGVTTYWLIDTEARTSEVLALGELDFEPVECFPEARRLTSPLLAGFSLDTAEVLRPWTSNLAWWRTG